MAVNLEEVLYGCFNIEFVGGKVFKKIEIIDFTLNGNGDLMYLVDKDGVIYNWSTIIKITRRTFKISGEL